jgi:imidazolonepropionase
MPIRADFVVTDAAELCTLAPGGAAPRRGAQMDEIGAIAGGAVAVRGRDIVAVGTTASVLAELAPGYARIDATGKLVTPGFIDPHVHLLWSGERSGELEEMAVHGVPYLEIKASGRGMTRTLDRTASASTDELERHGEQVLDTMLAHGTTTAEVKSGYEMTQAGELRQLEVLRTLHERQPVDLVSTFCAQGIPSRWERDVDGLTAEICREWIPRIASGGLAEYCDVFCERGYFDARQAERILRTGMDHGLAPRIHSDWLDHSGGAAVGSELRVVSADHLIFSTEQEIERLVASGTVGVLLPTSPFCYLGTYANARRILAAGLPLALGTDVSAANRCESLQMMMTLAVLRMKMTAAEALTAVTINAAHAVQRAASIGSLEVGKRADLVVFDAPSHRFFAYHYGVNLAAMVFKDGELVARDGRRCRAGASPAASAPG